MVPDTMHLNVSAPYIIHQLGSSGTAAGCYNISSAIRQVRFAVCGEKNYGK